MISDGVWEVRKESKRDVIFLTGKTDGPETEIGKSESRSHMWGERGVQVQRYSSLSQRKTFRWKWWTATAVLFGIQDRKNPRLTVHNWDTGVKSYREDALSDERKREKNRKGSKELKLRKQSSKERRIKIGHSSTWRPKGSAV